MALQFFVYRRQTFYAKSQIVGMLEPKGKTETIIQVKERKYVSKNFSLMKLKFLFADTEI